MRSSEAVRCGEAVALGRGCGVNLVHALVSPVGSDAAKAFLDLLLKGYRKHKETEKDPLKGSLVAHGGNPQDRTKLTASFYGANKGFSRM